jgi:hypothetical protein
MGFLDDTFRAAREFANPLSSGLASEGLKDAVTPVAEIAGGFGKSLGEGASKLWEHKFSLPFDTLLGTAAILPELKWDRPELDSSGTFEGMAKRYGGIAAGLGFIANKPFSRYGFLPTVLGSMIGAPLVKPVAGMAGRMVDKAVGTSPSPSEMIERFNRRISDEVASLKTQHPDAPEDQLGNYAVKKFLTEHPDYDLSVFQK